MLTTKILKASEKYQVYLDIFQSERKYLRDFISKLIIY